MARPPPGVPGVTETEGVTRGGYGPRLHPTKTPAARSGRAWARSRKRHIWESNWHPPHVGTHPVKAALRTTVELDMQTLVSTRGGQPLLLARYVDGAAIKTAVANVGGSAAEEALLSESRQEPPKKKDETS